jgi:histone deacetylase 1/2
VEEGKPVEQSEYLHLLGMLNYLTRSRPDLCTALSFGGTHSAKPSEKAFEALLDVVRYLWDTREKSLIIRSGEPGKALELTCYVDASYLTHRDSKSHTGYCMSFGKIGTFYAKSIKQQLVATSSTHAEVRALYQLILDVIFVINLCDELGRPVELPAVIMEDNQPAIDLSESLSSRVKKCKHFLMLVNFIREQVAAGLVDIQKVPTEDNIADLLTKALTGQAFTDKADFLLGILDDGDVI